MMAEIVKEATAADSFVVTPTMTKNINDIPEEYLIEILSNLPQNNLVVCREVCSEWRDTIDQHCPMKETIRLEEDDIFLDRKLSLRMTTCELDYFQKATPNITLTHPQTIKSFIFCDQQYPFSGNDKEDLNIENARGLLLQIAPFVEHLEFAATYFNNNILSRIDQFPKLRELHIGQFKYTMHNNLEILFSHLFPLLESLYLRLWYSSGTLMDETWINILNFLANHGQILRRVHIKMNCHLRFTYPRGPPDSTLAFNLYEKAKAILFKGQLESLELSIPPKYAPIWTPIIASQKKLINLTIGIECTTSAWENQVGFQFSGISPGILSNASTLRTVILHKLSPLTYDGLDWTLLDLSVFREVVNLTELDLIKSINSKNVPQPNKNEGAWITNLNEINSTSLKILTIHGFVCNSNELQILIDNAQVIETLVLVGSLAPRTSEKYAESGVHGGIIKSFVGKKSKKQMYIIRSFNYEQEDQNNKLNEVKELYPQRNDNDNSESFNRKFW